MVPAPGMVLGSARFKSATAAGAVGAVAAAMPSRATETSLGVRIQLSLTQMPMFATSGGLPTTPQEQT